MPLPSRIQIAILDDYPNVALTSADWSPLKNRADVTVFNDHLANLSQIIERLTPLFWESASSVRPRRERRSRTRSAIRELMSGMLEYDPVYWSDQQIRFQRMAIKSGSDLINEAKTRITEVGVAEATGAPNVVFLDVREPNEWNLGRIPGAKFIPRGQLETNVEKQIPRDANVVIYCASGNRSALAADTLRVMGYEHVSSLRGGFRAWVDAGGEVEG